ncbi:MAG: hypothetical protein IKR14_02655, partial [Lachnospiraceae bacterium]|nr:hypothetical protein [Lachnospiraceae bacterium]
NEPVKVAPLSYAGVFKWNNNKDKGIPGYVSVSPVNMDAEYIPLQEGMVYVPSAYFPWTWIATFDSRIRLRSMMIYILK